MTSAERGQEGPDDLHAVPAGVIRLKITDLDGAVTTRQLIDHLESNGATADEISTVASLPEREWADYNEALAAASSGFRYQPETPSSNT